MEETRDALRKEENWSPDTITLLPPICQILQVGSRGRGTHPKSRHPIPGYFLSREAVSRLQTEGPCASQAPALILSLLPSTHWPQPVQPPLPQVASVHLPRCWNGGQEAARPTQGQDCLRVGAWALGFEASALTVGSSPDIFHCP